MSDLYLELRSRIPVVAMRTHIGRQRLQDSQDAAGLSNERIARLIPISEKTWRRWKEAGEVPTYALPRVADALGLELVDARSSLDGDAVRPDLREEVAAAVAQLLDGQGEVLVRLAKIEAALDALAENQPARPARRSQSRQRR